jgi:hypothetical protein
MFQLNVKWDTNITMDEVQTAVKQLMPEVALKAVCIYIYFGKILHSYWRDYEL